MELHQGQPNKPTSIQLVVEDIECPPLEGWSEGIVGMQQERAYILARNSVEAWEPCRLCPGPCLTFGNEVHLTPKAHLIPVLQPNISFKAFLAPHGPCQKYRALGKPSPLVVPVLTPSPVLREAFYVVPTLGIPFPDSSATLRRGTHFRFTHRIRLS